MTQESRTHSFVTHLESLAEDRGALAALRRGLGREPGAAPEMYPYVVPYLPAYATPGSWPEQVYYLVAALFALHPGGAQTGSLGAHFGRAVDAQSGGSEAIERRFSALLTAHPDDLHFHMRQAVSFLKSREIAINWHQLMWDLLSWSQSQQQTRVLKRWAADFWRRHSQNEPVASS